MPRVGRELLMIITLRDGRDERKRCTVKKYITHYLFTIVSIIHNNRLDLDFILQILSLCETKLLFSSNNVTIIL